MKTAVDIAEGFTDAMFEALIRSEQVRAPVPAGSTAVRRRHVIDAAGFDTDGSIMFDGEFDFHYGRGGDAAGHPALRAHVEGHLAHQGDDRWVVRRLLVTSLERVDAALGPDELSA